MLMHYIPEVEAVENIEPEVKAEEINEEELSKLETGLAKVKGSHRHRNRERAENQ